MCHYRPLSIHSIRSAPSICSNCRLHIVHRFDESFDVRSHCMHYVAKTDIHSFVYSYNIWCIYKWTWIQLVQQLESFVNYDCWLWIISNVWSQLDWMCHIREYEYKLYIYSNIYVERYWPSIAPCMHSIVLCSSNSRKYNNNNYNMVKKSDVSLLWSPECIHQLKYSAFGMEKKEACHTGQTYTQR